MHILSLLVSHLWGVIYFACLYVIISLYGVLQ